MVRCKECNKETRNKTRAKEVCECRRCSTCQEILPGCNCCTQCNTTPCRCCHRCEKDPDHCTCCQTCQQSTCKCCRYCKKLRCQCNMSFIEPPDIATLKDKSNLDFYINALEGWAECGGYQAEKQADVIFLYAFKTYPELCKELQDHFGKTLKGKAEGVTKITERGSSSPLSILY